MSTSLDRVTRKVAKKPRIQVSLGVMLVVMLVFALVSVGLSFATRIEEVQNELAIIFGPSSFTERESNRRTHLTFLLFTYASPLMLALVLSTANNFLNRRR